ncbi:MAG: MEDS domain-containing protein [Candidatus Bathyarchaeia archaeon]
MWTDLYRDFRTATSSSAEDGLREKIKKTLLTRAKVTDTVIRSVPKQILDHVKGLSAHDHVVHFYETEEDKHRVLFSFVESKLKSGEIVQYYIHGGKPGEVKGKMKKHGIDVDRFEKDGLLEIIDFRSLGVRPDISPKDAKDVLKGIYEAKGRRPMNIIADDPLLVWDPKKLSELEEGHGRRLETPIVFFCVYPSRKVTKIRNDRLYLDLIKAHGHAIFPGVALKLVE